MEAFLNSIDETSITYIVLNRWLPGVITVVVGGYVASILFPKLQQNAQRNTQVREKRTEIAEEIVQYFNRYIISWRRLIQIAKLEEVRELSDDEVKRKNGFVLERNERRDLLFDKLKLCQLYFCDRTCSEIQNFVSWDEKQSSRPLEELPDLEVWRTYEVNIIGLIKNELV
ncbi:hypothetical protein [Lentilitoribacter sp. Alg239-R112]|uniref:hypothetical protein n=1 Tax=Lentilitoribacter sp. Alg239-R112 TaxID=2305987 RepID=UPI0013A6D9EC|nr:hypothetical protein [Lentilitoribacter sp. Alg239-R112]